MANFFSDNVNLSYRFSRLHLEDALALEIDRIKALDRDGRASQKWSNPQEAAELFEEALTLCGDIAANFIAPRSSEIDRAGTILRNGSVEYSAQMLECRKVLSDTGFMGVMLPMEHGGMGFPATIYAMLIEMVSRGDASLMTLFGYQDVGELIARFGTSDQAQEFLPDLASGEKIGAIVLSEPGAGSDLQAVQLAAKSTSNGEWRLNGTKHFISNGCADVLIVLARSEQSIKGAFGLSLFVCPKSESVQVTRVEDKMGLHGSPTCELQFVDAPAQLLGNRKFGLTRYVMENLNQARFSVAAQALGIAEGAYQSASEFAHQRVQFGRKIIEFPAIDDMLTSMSDSLQSSRAMLYEAVQWLDYRLQLAVAMEQNFETSKIDLATQYRYADKITRLLSPLVKYAVTESATSICHNAQQIFGGLGYMRDTGLERRVRDVRVTTIYEGTSQVQVAASLKLVLADVLAEEFDKWHEKNVPSDLKDVVEMIGETRRIFSNMVATLKSRSSGQVLEAAARDLADVYGNLFAAYVLFTDVLQGNGSEALARRFANTCFSDAMARHLAIDNGRYDRWLE